MKLMIRKTNCHTVGGVCFADEDTAALLGDSLGELHNPDSGNWQLVKRNPSRSVYRGSIGSMDVYLKHFHSTTFVRRLARFFGLSHAMREMRFSRYLSSIGVPCPFVLAVKCSDGIEWLAMKTVAESVQGDQWHEELFRRGDNNSMMVVRRAGIALASMIGRMHAGSVVHHDLHCGNVLVRTDTAEPELVLIDLHRASRRRLSRRAMAANLAQLLHDRYDFTTRSERLRFLKHYLAACGAPGSLRGWRMMVEDFARAHASRIYA